MQCEKKLEFFSHIENLIQKTEQEHKNTSFSKFITVYNEPQSPLRKRRIHYLQDDKPPKSQTKKIKTNSKEQPKQIFKDLRFMFVCGVKHLSTSRASILQEKVLQRGGKITSSLKQADHIITGLSYSNLLKRLGVTSIKVKVHSPQWITDCIILGKLVQDEMYEMNTQSSQPVEEKIQNPSPDINLSDFNSSDESILYPFEEKTKVAEGFTSDFAKKTKLQLACQTSPTKVNHNKEITDELERLAEIYNDTGDEWRAMAYRKAASALKRHHKKITSGEEARKIKGIGKKTADKIHELITFGHISKLDALEQDEKTRIIQLFSGIFGVGSETAKKWYAQGFRTLDDLKRHAKLTHQHLIGLKYYNDFKQRIPRDEVAKIEQFVQQCAAEIDKKLKVVACGKFIEIQIYSIAGSYRRGKPDCGDVDLLISNPTQEEDDGILHKIIQILKEKQFIVDDLALPKKDKKKTDDHREMYMGVCKLKNYTYFRRIDIKVYPEDCFCFALLYFTGNDYFNRSMRFYAKKNGFSLSDRALKPVIRVQGKKIYSGPPIQCRTERDIFEAMGLEYKEPHEREI